MANVDVGTAYKYIMDNPGSVMTAPDGSQRKWESDTFYTRASPTDAWVEMSTGVTTNTDYVIPD